MYGGYALTSAIKGEEEALLTYEYLMEKAFQGYLEKLVVHYSNEKRWQEEPYWKGRLNIQN